MYLLLYYILTSLQKINQKKILNVKMFYIAFQVLRRYLRKKLPVTSSFHSCSTSSAIHQQKPIIFHYFYQHYLETDFCHRFSFPKFN